PRPGTMGLALVRPGGSGHADDAPTGRRRGIHLPGVRRRAGRPRRMVAVASPRGPADHGRGPPSHRLLLRPRLLDRRRVGGVRPVPLAGSAVAQRRQGLVVITTEGELLVAAVDLAWWRGWRVY